MLQQPFPLGNQFLYQIAVMSGTLPCNGFSVYQHVNEPFFRLPVFLQFQCIATFFLERHQISHTIYHFIQPVFSVIVFFCDIQNFDAQFFQFFVGSGGYAKWNRNSGLPDGKLLCESILPLFIILSRVAFIVPKIRFFFIYVC